MAGFSVVLLFGWIMVAGAAVGFAFLVYLLYSYIFESLFCTYVSQSRWCWIPVWGQYLMGQTTGSRKLGLALALDHLIIIVLCCASYSKYVETVVVLLLLLIVLGVALKAIVAHRLYKIAAPERYKVLSVISILSLGLLRPIFLFALRKKVCMFSKNT